jgi:hypothetical protein
MDPQHPVIRQGVFKETHQLRLVRPMPYQSLKITYDILITIEQRLTARHQLIPDKGHHARNGKVIGHLVGNDMDTTVLYVAQNTGTCPKIYANIYRHYFSY